MHTFIFFQRCMTATKFKNIFKLLFLVLNLSNCLLAVVPKDKKPLKVYNDSQSYAVFRGAHLSGKTDSQNSPKLDDFQGMKEINGNYYVYAKNYIFVLGKDTPLSSSNHIQHKQELEWKSVESRIDTCKSLGRTPDECQNYIKILQGTSKEDQMIACATNAFDPDCRNYQLLKNGTLRESKSDPTFGIYSCPYVPTKSVASVVTDNILYTATEVGFNGQNAMVHRVFLGNADGINLRTSRKDITMLNDPRFIRFVDAGRSLNKIYIFFTEVAVEDNSYQMYTRAGQVCKNDQGGRDVLRNEFSSFFRVRLNCSLPGQPPFYFNEMSDVTDILNLNKWYSIGGTKMVFAIMNTPRNSIPASAICAFTLADIERAMTGSFLQKYSPEGSQSSYWGKADADPRSHPASCVRNPRQFNNEDLIFIRDHPLMHDTVPAWDLKSNATTNHASVPLFSRMMSGTFLSAFAVDINAGTLSMYTVFIAGTEDGKIVKILLLQSGQTIVVEERVIFNEENCGKSNRKVLKISLDKSNGTMLVAFQSCLVQAPLCPINTTCGRECIESRDPYCAWDGKSCVTVGKDTSSDVSMRGSTQPRQDCIEGNVDGMPDCVEPVVIVPPGDGAISVKSTFAPVNESNVSNNGSAVVDGRNVAISKTADSKNLIVILGIVALLLGIVILGIGLVLICRSGQCKRKKLADDNLELKFTNVSQENGHVTDSRRESNQSSARIKSRHPSNGSHHASRHSNPRMSSMIEESKRNRTITESSNRSDEGGVFVGAGDLPTPDTPRGKDFPDSARKKQVQSTSSSVGGRRKPRNSKHSTSSGPENSEEMKGSPMKKYPPGHLSDVNGYDDPFDDEEEFARQGSNDSGHGSEGFVSPQESEPLTTLAPTYNKMARNPPSRSLSLQAPSHHPFQRTYSVDPHTSTMGYTRPHARMVRQHSLQVPDTMQKQMHPRYAPQLTPSLNMPPVWPEQPQPVVTATPSSTLNYDSRMATRSLDRRRPKDKGYQLAFSESYDESKHQQAMGKQNGAPSTRKRYMSESASENARMPMTRPTQCHPIHEEQEPLMSHPEDRPLDTKPLRNHLHLNLNPGMMENTNPQGSHSAPIMDPALMQARRFPGRMVAHSNPGTPQREIPPSFADQVHPLSLPKHHPTLLSQKQHFIPHPGVPEELSPFSDISGQESRVSPIKSNPSSPMHDGRPPSFPNSERHRHYSGHANGMHQAPLTPVRTTAPVSFGTSPYNNNNPVNGTKVRHASGGNGRKQNGLVFNGIPPEGPTVMVGPGSHPVQHQTSFS